MHFLLWVLVLLKLVQLPPNPNQETLSLVCLDYQSMKQSLIAWDLIIPGVEHLLQQVKKSSYNNILGINIGKNFDTPIENATDDYLIGLRKSYDIASYITLNISSPNTKNLRQLQQGDEIKNLLSKLKEEQLKLQQKYDKYTPLVVKIAPDLNDDEVIHIAKLLLEFNIDGVIATNTTISREAVQGHIHADECGGAKWCTS